MIETERLILRTMKISDAEMMFKNWTSDKEVTKFLTWEPHANLDVTKEWINHCLEHNLDNLLIVYKENNEPIGSISIVNSHADNTSCEVGYCLGKEYWNKGIMTEALRAFVKDLFKVKNYNYIIACHDVNNPASGKVMEKCGFRPSFIKSELNKNGDWLDLKYYSLNYEEFKINNLILDLKNNLNVDVYSASTIEDFIKKLKYADVSYLEVDMIDNPKIKKVSSLESYNFYILRDGIRKYYFLAPLKNEHRLKEMSEYFIHLNQEYFISLHGKSIEYLLVKTLREKKLHISFAESCTGGLMVATLINIPGASNVINESLVTYSEDSKMMMLGVEENTLKQYSVYSKEVAKEMAQGLYNITKAEICVSITGLAGGEERNPSDGSYDFGIILHKSFKDSLEIIEHKVEKGTRNEVRKKQVNYVLFKVLKLVNEYFVD